MTKTIQILNHLPSTITTRKAIEIIRGIISVSGNNPVVFDFEGVDFISRAFADEYVHFLKDKGINARIVNTSPNVMEMLKAVKKNREGRKTNYHNIAVTKFSGKEQLNRFLSLI